MGWNVLEDMGVNGEDEKGWKGYMDGVNWRTLDKEMGRWVLMG